MLRVPPAALAQWLQAGEGHALNEHLYVVDPLGNWMMRFPAGLNAETALKAKRDLDQLMRAARFWGPRWARLSASMETNLYDLSPILRVLLIGALVASVPALWVYLRNRNKSAVGRYQALVVVTLFLTFDLVLFGAFTRLTDSGLGCPDWPGCYGNASPLGARHEIAEAQSALPGGPVTHGKAWIEMVHRYMATSVGALITLMVSACLAGTEDQRRIHAPNPWWASFTLVWVCIQGAFGALTVTMKLFPAIVTLHLLGGYTLLALLMAQAAHGGHGGTIANPV